MKKFTLFLAFVVAFTTTAFGQIDTGKQYRLKSVTVGDYLTIAETNANTHGHVCGMPLDDNNQDQVFSFIDATNGQYYLKSATGKYFTDRGTGTGWNVNYSMNADEALAMTFEQIGENTYKIKCYNDSKNAELYFKYEYVGASGLYHPFNDSNDGAEWVLEEASTIPQEMLAEARNAFNAAYETAIATIEAANLVIEKEDLPLQTTDANSAYYTWSNAPEPTEGPIDQLVDGIAEHGNFFHTQWNNPVPAAPHYIEVDLGENNDLEKFVISYTTRINNNGTIADFPDAIEILGSNDKNEYTSIAIFNDKLPQSQGQKWESTIAVNNGFRYLRLNVTAEKIFWHMAEFDITKMITNINESYRNVIVEIAALKTICENVANNADYGYYQLLEATATLNAAVEAVKAGVAEPEPETPFEVVAVTPTEAVAELTTVTVEFSEEIEGTFDMMGMKQIYLGTKSNGCSFEVNGKVLTITPFNAINTPGEYKLVIPVGLITRKSNGEAVTMNGEYVFTVKEAEAQFEVVAVTPTEAVAELTTVTVEFSEEIEGTFDMMGMKQIYLGTKSNGCSFEVNGKVLTITPFNAINTPGEYKLVIPEGLITRKSNGEAVTMNGEYVFTVKEAEAQFEVVAVTPTEAVAELTTVTVEFSEEIEGTFDMMGMKQIYLGTKSNGCSFEVNGKVLTITPFNAINTPGEYKLVIPEGLITRKSNGEAVTMNGEYVFTVEEPIVEPEPETPSALNETVVFDFASQNWGIATIEQNNYSNIKTAGEYTDGKYTINIDPTANGGSYIYDSKGFLNISKPGSKIVLPAFDFAVEKIEVVGHASATSYSKVDMNVFVGGTAVSTACIGSTETYTYEIAADNQAAGNVYELVIGSNGGNYSSVMYITYIKVYPAENKLEAPAIDLASGVYIGEQTVNVHSATADLEGVTNVTYYYTTDGNEPSVEDEDTDGEITITESCTLKVIVELTYGDKTYVSASTSAEYIISEAVTYHRATDVESGNYFLAANGHVAAPLANNVLPAVETTIDGNDLTEAAYYAITLEEAAEAGTYYIKDVNGNYIYTSSMYGTSGPKLSSNGAYVPMSSWTITIADDENSTATIVSEGLTLVYDTAAGVFKVTDSVSSDMILPTFYGTHATGIVNIGANGNILNGENNGIYDLQGRKIETVTKGGIYIVNGKKVLVK